MWDPNWCKDEDEEEEKIKFSLSVFRQKNCGGKLSWWDEEWATLLLLPLLCQTHTHTHTYALSHCCFCWFWCYVLMMLWYIYEHWLHGGAQCMWGMNETENWRYTIQIYAGNVVSGRVEQNEWMNGGMKRAWERAREKERERECGVWVHVREWK